MRTYTKDDIIIDLDDILSPAYLKDGSSLPSIWLLRGIRTHKHNVSIYDM